MEDMGKRVNPALEIVPDNSLAEEEYAQYLPSQQSKLDEIDLDSGALRGRYDLPGVDPVNKLVNVALHTPQPHSTVISTS